MKTFLLSLVMTAVVTGAMAQPGPTTLDMACAEVAGVVASQGAVVLRTGPTTYDRYVRDTRFCMRGEILEPAWVRTADVAQCYIGSTCVQRRPRAHD
jgi:hypothetical protein